ncbi:MAG: hypothetical protein JSS82_06060 [Bacteroidetes bacterium]|nr:hypothetical protein [Bacteroidota bacterium]
MKRLVYIGASATAIAITLALAVKPWKHDMKILGICFAAVTILLSLIVSVKNKRPAPVTTGPMRQIAYLALSAATITLLIGYWMKPWKHTTTLAAICLTAFSMVMLFGDMINDRNRPTRH